MKSGSPSSGILRRSVPVTFVDANILFSRVLRDYFLYRVLLQSWGSRKSDVK